VRPLAEALHGWVEFVQSGAALVSRATPEREQGAVALGRVVEALVVNAPLLGVVLFSEHGADFYRDHLRPAIDEFVSGIEAAKQLWDHREFGGQLPANVVLGTALFAGLRQSFEESPPVDYAAFADELQGLIFDGLRLRGPAED